MLRLDRVIETSLYVDDLDRAARFYEQVMGLQALTSDARFRAYDVGGKSVLLLFRRGATLKTVRMPGGTIPPHDGHGPLHMAFAVPAAELAEWDVEQLAADLDAGLSLADWFTPDESAVLTFVALSDQNVRMDEYTFGTQTALGDAYGDFLVSDLLPKVESNVRVCTSASARGISGASLGGLISTYLAFGRPDVWEPEEVFWGPEDTWLGDERYSGFGAPVF